MARSEQESAGVDGPAPPVVVVGAGAAGLMAAVAAAESGVRPVAVLEAAPRLGGSSSRSVGSITASATALQASRGIEDDPDAHLEDLLAGQDEEARAAAEPLLAAIAAESGPVVDWLAGIGVKLAGPHPEPPHRVPRMHSVQPSGLGLLERLERHALDRGVKVLKRARALGAARVAGGSFELEVEGMRQPLAAGAVVIAAGDASASFRIEDPAEPPPVYPHARGDGMRIAAGLGARVNSPWPSRQIRSSDPPHYHPDRGFFSRGVIAVGGDGSFLTDRHELLAAEVAAAPSPAFLIFDRSVAEQVATAADDGPRARDGWTAPGRCFVSTFPGIAYAYLDDLLERGLGRAAPSLSRLATGLGMEPGALDRYAAPPFGLARPPFYALGPMGGFIVLSDGGLDTDERQRVLDQEGRPLPGLFAAGASAWGPFHTRGHGVHLAWALVSGRRAGRAAAASG